MIGHRSDEFEALFAKCEEQLQATLLTPTSVSTSWPRPAPACRKLRSATAWARTACSTSSTAPSASAGTMSPSAAARRPSRVDVEWNTAVKPEQVGAALDAGAGRRPGRRHHRRPQRDQHRRHQPGGRDRRRGASHQPRDAGDGRRRLLVQRRAHPGRRVGASTSADLVAEGAGAAARSLVLRRERPGAGAGRQVEGRGWYFDFLNAGEVPQEAAPRRPRRPSRSCAH